MAPSQAEIQENREKPAHRKKDIALYRDEAASMIDEDLKARWYKAVEFNKAKAAKLEQWFEKYGIPSVAALDAVERMEVKAEAQSEGAEATGAAKAKAGAKEKAKTLRAEADAPQEKRDALRREADAQQKKIDALRAEADELEKAEDEAEADAPGQGLAEENYVVSDLRGPGRVNFMIPYKQGLCEEEPFPTGRTLFWPQVYCLSPRSKAETLVGSTPKSYSPPGYRQFLKATIVEGREIGDVPGHTGTVNAMPLEVVNPVKVANYVYIDDEDVDEMVEQLGMYRSQE